MSVVERARGFVTTFDPQWHSQEHYEMAHALLRAHAALQWYANPETYEEPLDGPPGFEWPASGKILEDEGAKAREALADLDA